MTDSGNTNPRHLITLRLRRFFQGPAGTRSLGDERPQRRGLVITLCVLAACLLWFTFSMRESYTQVFDFPTAVRNLPEHLALSALPPSTVRVQVQGEGIQLLRLYYNPPTVPIDVSQERIDVEVVTSELTKSVRSEAVVPRIIVPQTETKVEKRLPIDIRVRIVPAPGFRIIGNLHASPDSVTVSGAISILDRLRSWPTQTRELRAVKDSVQSVVALLDTLSGLVHTGMTETVVSANVLEFTEGNRVLPVRVTGAPAGQQVSLDPSSVVVRYQIPIIQFDEAFNSEDFEAVVFYNDLQSDTTGSITPRILFPDRLSLREIRVVPSALGYFYVQ